MTVEQERPFEPSDPGTVVLDIGGSTGAAIVRAPATLTGSEVEIRREGEPWEGRHVAVRARRLAQGGVIHAALFDRLPAGFHQVRVRDRSCPGPAHTFDVRGGRVTEVELEDQLGGV
jgi:hypothetical protein